MLNRFGVARTLLLITTAITSQSVSAQSDGGGGGVASDGGSTAVGTEPGVLPAAAPDGTTADSPSPDGSRTDSDETEVSIPGGGLNEIVVQGKFTPNIVKSTPQVVTALSTEEIARTGEGDIAGALGRVTGLSVVGSGFVYVRGLGDRYSLALLNGSPLPSPEPLKRVVPLDLFPTNIIASSLVQKSYSVNFPGEFGGGVINLTTKAVPEETYLTVGAGGNWDTETTNKLGYTYYGGKYDWTGFDNGSRRAPASLDAFFKSGRAADELSIAERASIISAVGGDARFSVLQRNKKMPASGSASLTAGTAFDMGDARMGVIFTAGYSNKWDTRDILQQASSAPDLASIDENFRRVVTGNRVVLNGLLSVGAEFDNNKVRWTNLYIRDTLKQSRLGLGQTISRVGADILAQNTAWFERQLIDTQIVGEFELTEDLHLDVRVAYANSQREAPNELSLDYVRTNDTANDPLAGSFRNSLGSINALGRAGFAYSNLEENLYSGGLDLSYRFTDNLAATIGYAFSDTNRFSVRRAFSIQAPSTFDQPVGLLRPDLLLGNAPATFYGYQLNELSSFPAFAADLTNHAGYVQLEAQIVDGVSLSGGVRYETAKQSVATVPVFSGQLVNSQTALDNDYWLPAATLTWEVAPDMQLRLNASKTIARPQFRELIFQPFFDPESNSFFTGNPNLVDSKFKNAEARFEYYFAPEQRVSAAAFIKKIDRPIETYVTAGTESGFATTFANAPKATLYGAEIDVQKFFDLAGLSDGAFWANRRFAVLANYTYTKSEIKVGVNDTVVIFPSLILPAAILFRDGASLTGQADHIANLQIGLEDTETLSQQTLLVSYTSKRVTRRGLNTGQPDVFEHPGLQLDFVARQGVRLGGLDTEFKFEVRNITGTKYQEYQQLGDNRVTFNRYRRGTTIAGSFNVTF